MPVILPSSLLSLDVRVGDCRELMREMPDESVQCCVTSPPYWGLRDYGHDGQIGQEETPEAFVQALVEVFNEVRRVMSDWGTLWLNIGDSYARAGGWSDNSGLNGVKRGMSGRATSNLQKNTNGQKLPAGLKSKDLCGMPWRLAFALQSAGWYLRNDIIWKKTNPMPESATDRCSKSHEHLFMLTKSERYYFDWDALPIRNKKDVWETSTSTYDGAHFATYPPDLIKPCIMAGTKPGDVVLDPFGGSGTTGQVALELGRRAILCELNPDYAEIIHQRTNVTMGLAL
jgi:DNA modification methylase